MDQGFALTLDEEARKVGHEARGEHHTRPQTHPVEQRDLVLHRHEGHRRRGHALQPHLQDACGGEEQGDEDHRDRHQPEAPHLAHLGTLIVGGTTAQQRHRVADDRQHHQHVGAVEGHVTVGRGDLRTVRVVVHRSQGVQEAPHAGAEEGHHAGAQCPQHGCLVRVLAAAAVHHVEGEHGHREERDRFQGREHRAQPLPVFRRADPEVVVAGTDQAGDERQGDDHVQPLLDHFAVDPGHLDQHEGEDGGHDQFPHAFHPEVHNPPPVELVLDQVARVVEREQEEDRKTPQAHQQHDADDGLAALQHGHRDVEQEGQRHDHDARLGDQRLLQELPSHRREQVVAGHLGERRVRHQQVAENRRRARDQEDPEHQQGEFRAIQLGFRLLGHEEVGGAHEAEQQPHDEQVGMHHPRHVERDLREEEIADDVLQTHGEAEDDLSHEETDGRYEVRHRDRLR